MYNPTKPYKKQILELIKQTWQTPYVSVQEDIYPIVAKRFSYPEVDHTDGIGTKGFYHWQQRSFRNACLDALAMNLNDLALVRAIPYKIQNHILIPEDDVEAILEIIKTLSEECRKRNIAITGGETSIQDNINGMDVSMTISGFIENYKPNRFQRGDVLIGIKSNGLHSNGFTKVREVFKKEYRDEFINPTRIYLDTILDLDKRVDIHGMMHITGGAYTKLKDLLNNTDALLVRNPKIQLQDIFLDLYRRGISDEDMYRIFNCGIGFIFSVSEGDLEKVISNVEDSYAIGRITSGEGRVKIESMFSNKRIEF